MKLVSRGEFLLEAKADTTNHCGHETVLVAIETGLVCRTESLHLVESSYNRCSGQTARAMEIKGMSRMQQGPRIKMD